MKELIGNIIFKIEVSDGEEFIRFTTSDKIIVYGVEGDCCSESWFAEILGMEYLIDSYITDVNEIDMDWYNTDDGKTRQEEDIAYGYEIITRKGSAKIVFRNSSNGYYGGMLKLMENICISYLKYEKERIKYKIISNEHDWSA